MKSGSAASIVLKTAAACLTAAGLFFVAAPPVAAIQYCPLRDPTGSIECVNAGTSWCGNTCQAEPLCPIAPGSKTQLDCATCSCTCPSGRTACDGMSAACQLNNTSCASLNRQQTCSTSGDVMTCGACLDGFTDCGNVCLPSNSASCRSPKVYDACSGACREYVVASPAAAQNAYISVTGDIHQGGDLFMSSGRAIRLDGTGATGLNLANFGGGQFTLSVGGTAQVATSLAVGLPAVPTLASVGDNLIYGVMSDTSLGNLLKLETKNASGIWTSRFAVDRLGQLTVGDIPWPRLSSFPAACAAGQFVRGIGAALLCETLPPSAPTGPAGGVLAGSYPNPTFAPNAVVLGRDTSGSYVSSLAAGSGLSVSPLSGTGNVTISLRDPLPVSGLTLGGVTRTTWPSLDVVTENISDTACAGPSYHRYSCPAGYVFVGWTGINCIYRNGWSCDESQAGPTYVDVVVDKNGASCNTAINIKLRCARLD